MHICLAISEILNPYPQLWITDDSGGQHLKRGRQNPGPGQPYVQYVYTHQARSQDFEGEVSAGAQYVYAHAHCLTRDPTPSDNVYEKIYEH